MDECSSLCLIISHSKLFIRFLGICSSHVILSGTCTPGECLHSVLVAFILSSLGVITLHAICDSCSLLVSSLLEFVSLAVAVPDFQSKSERVLVDWHYVFDHSISWDASVFLLLVQPFQ